MTYLADIGRYYDCDASARYFHNTAEDARRRRDAERPRPLIALTPSQAGRCHTAEPRARDELPPPYRGRRQEQRTLPGRESTKRRAADRMALTFTLLLLALTECRRR